MATTAVAHPNIALVKYWGKQDKTGNLPATPNLSVTLDTLKTTTEVEWHSADQDEIVLNGKPQTDQKIAGFLTLLRSRFDLPPLQLVSENNFPTGAGLASSASGFAALICALNQHAELQLDVELMSDWARQGSASAARSMHSGFVALTPPLWRAQQLAPAEYWPLKVVVAITSHETKQVSSSEGMERTRLTSPFYKAWLGSSMDDYSTVNDAISTRSFPDLATAAEQSCLKMHAIMLTSKPTLLYWNSATLQCMQVIQSMREAGTGTFFSIDAGPQLKAFCLPEAAAEVAAELSAIPGVLKTITCGIGDGAHVVS